MSSPVYRQARPEDAQTIAAFQLAMALETEGLHLDPAVCLNGVRAVFEIPSLGRFYVCERDAKVIGSALTTYEWSDWRNGVVWWIQSVYVDPDYRKQGVYAGIYAFIRDLANADDNVQGIRLYVDRRNAVAMQVYSRLGMDGEHYQVFEWMKPAPPHADGPPAQSKLKSTRNPP